MNQRIKCIDLKWSGVLVGGLLFFSACSLSPNAGVAPTKLTDEISPLDGGAIIQIEDKTLLGNSYFETYRNKVIANYGSELIKVMNEGVEKAKRNPNELGAITLLKDITPLKAKAQETIPSHFRITDEAGHTEDFTLGIRKYISDGKAHLKT